jgi:arginase family enzyme
LTTYFGFSVRILIFVKTSVVVLPFDLFGSSGAGKGAQLLADALREMLADNRREKIPTRANAYTRKVSIQEISLETLPDLQAWRGKGRTAARAALARGDFLLWITGNHLGALPVFEVFGRPQGNDLVIQLDAHLDIYHLTDCTQALSHGNFLLHAETPLPPLLNVGNRELLLKADHVAKYYRETFSAAQFATQPDEVLQKLRAAAGSAGRVVLDIDCDVFDPCWFPAVSHPLPFGLSPEHVLRVLEAVWTDRMIGVCLSEFDPARDTQDRSLAALVWLLEYFLLKLYE